MTGLFERFKGFLAQSKRVYQVTKKPSRTEFSAIVKVTGLGLIIIGLIGFVITIAAQILI